MEIVYHTIFVMFVQNKRYKYIELPVRGLKLAAELELATTI